MNSKVVENRGRFLKGRTKTGGRQKGTPNKRTADIIERLQDTDIVGALLEIAQTTNKEEVKVTVYKELLKYIYPQRKAIDIDTGTDAGITVNINREAVGVERDITKSC